MPRPSKVNVLFFSVEEVFVPLFTKLRSEQCQLLSSWSLLGSTPSCVTDSVTSCKSLLPHPNHL